MSRKRPEKKKSSNPYKEQQQQVKYQLKPKTENQANLLRTIAENDITLTIGPAGSGKTALATCYGMEKFLEGRYKRLIITRPAVEAGEEHGFLPGPQPLDSLILTPEGWKTIGDIKPGDFVVSPDGTRTTVLAKSDVNYEPYYEIEMSDGSKMECATNHLFYTQTFNDYKHNKEGSVKSLLEIENSLLYKNKKLNHYLPDSNPISFKYEKKHIISPYILGALLGDGCFSGYISLCSIDQEIIDRIIKECVIDHSISNREGLQIIHLNTTAKNNKPSKSIIQECVVSGDIKTYDTVHEFLEKNPHIKKGTVDWLSKKAHTNDGFIYKRGPKQSESTNLYKNELIRLGLYDKRAIDKFIPSEYIYNSSIEDRISLLRGLMDTDGTNDGKASAFTTISYNLALNIVELVKSLGGRASIYSRNRVGKKTLIKSSTLKTKHISYEVCINTPFNPFHLSRKAAKYNPKYRHKMKIKNITKKGYKFVQCLNLESKDGLYITNNYIVTHNSIKDKMDPYLQPIYGELCKYVTMQQLQTYLNNGKNKLGQDEIIIAPLAYMRGMNFHDSFMIMDEAQNATYEQIKMFITRVGFNSKCVLSGDPRQSDRVIHYKNTGISEVGLEKWIEIIGNVPGVGVAQLTKSDIIRNPIITRILDAIGE